MSSDFAQKKRTFAKTIVNSARYTNQPRIDLCIMATFPLKRSYTMLYYRETFPICQISDEYSLMVRSELNFPALQMLSQHFFAKAMLSAL